MIFLDIQLPGLDGLAVLQQLRTLAPQAAVIIMTAHGNLETAVQAVAGGAFDYLAKPFDLTQALDALQRANTRQPAGNSNSAEARRTDLDELIGQSAVMQLVFKRIALVAPTNAAVLITGESGTGKELVARALHRHSPRRDKPFLPIHVAALNPNLVESELFGHMRGAFTGADRNRQGLLVLAHGGTVFLDELGDIPLPVQAKLLRVVERQEVLPVGGAEPQAVNVRIISATNADLSRAVAEGRFRHDLYFRLNVYPIHLPPLRERLDDIPALAEAFVKQFADNGLTLADEAISALKQRPWPGNIRELKNALEHAAIEARGGAIRSEHFPPPSRWNGAVGLDDTLANAVRDWVRDAISRVEPKGEPAELYQRALELVEPAILAEVLQRLQGNRLVAARWLGLARATVRKMIRKYNLGPATDDDSEETAPEPQRP